MADMADTLRQLLGENADSKLSGIMNILNDSSGTPAQQNPTPSPDMSAPELFSQAQQLFEGLSAVKNDERSALLNSLKPFMSKERQNSIDNAVKMMSLAHLSQFFTDGGGKQNV
jgi:hypothetical protein